MTTSDKKPHDHICSRCSDVHSDTANLTPLGWMELDQRIGGDPDGAAFHTLCGECRDEFLEWLGE
jgi:hypothetical protein